MQILEFNLDGQKLTKARDFPDVVSNSNKYLKMVVKGIPDGFVATAYFILSWDTTSIYNLVLQNGEIYIDEYLTTLPKDLSEYFDYTLSVSIAAVNGDGVRITSNPIIIKIDKSNFSPETTNTPQIPENQIEEVLSKISPATSETYGTVKVADDKDMAILVGGIYPDENNGKLTIAPATEDLIDMRFNDCAPIVPANLEYAVKSVGDGYYAKVGEGGGENVPKEYEIINTITVLPDTDGTLPQHVIFSTDSEGNPFELTDFMVRCYAGFADGSKSTLYMQVNEDSVIANGAISSISSSLRGFMIYYRTDSDGFKTAKYTSSTAKELWFDAQAPIQATRILPPLTPVGNPPITNIDLYTATGTTKAWVEGSTFKLYGVRK